MNTFTNPAIAVTQQIQLLILYNVHAGGLWRIGAGLPQRERDGGGVFDGGQTG